MKIQILNNCLECGHHEWLRGKPRCKHPDLKLSEPDDDGVLFPRCPTDGTREFREDCPLIDSSLIDISSDWFVNEIKAKIEEKGEGK